MCDRKYRDGMACGGLLSAYIERALTLPPPRIVSSSVYQAERYAQGSGYEA